MGISDDDARNAENHFSGRLDDPPSRDEGEQVMLLAAVALSVAWVAGPNYLGLPLTDYQGPAWWSALIVATGAAAAWAIWNRWPNAGLLALGQVVASGIADRLVRPIRLESDAQLAAAEAVRVLLDGSNPYAHEFTTVSTESASLGSVFPYLPGYMLYYRLSEAWAGTVDGADRWTSIGIVIALASLFPIVGFGRAALVSAIFGTWMLAGYRSLDGSSDTTVTFLILLGIVLLAYAHRDGGWHRGLVIASALAFSWAILFKQFAWIIAPFVLLWLVRSRGPWRLWGGIQAALFLAATIPFLLADPGPFLTNVLILDSHRNVWGLNLWASVQRYVGVDALPSVAVLHIVQFGIVALAALVLVRRSGPDSLADAVFRGAAVMFLLIFLGTWTTSPYYIPVVVLLMAAAALRPRLSCIGVGKSPIALV